MRDKARRVAYFPAALELIQRSRLALISKENPNQKDEIVHRFAGITPDQELFFVQIKEDRRKDQKWLMSVFPLNK